MSQNVQSIELDNSEHNHHSGNNILADKLHKMQFYFHNETKEHKLWNLINLLNY